MIRGMSGTVAGGIDDASLVAQSRAISRELRQRRQALDDLHAPGPIGAGQGPDVYFDLGPSGQYPIVALRTVPCDLYSGGSCVPCAYSARPSLKRIQIDEYPSSLLEQLDRLFLDFRHYFGERADGTLAGIVSSGRERWYTLQLAGQSSFFRDAEIPRAARRALLERVIEWQSRLGVRFQVMLECRPEHLVVAETSGELEYLSVLLDGLRAVVNMGCEYHDDDLRNVLFDKRLSRADFEAAVAVAHRRRLDPGIFAFAGGHVLLPSEVLESFDETLHYFKAIDVFANVMVPNTQAFSLPDLLYDIGCYTLPEPFFLLDVIDRLIEYRPARKFGQFPFHWFVGGLVTDPPARRTLLDHPRRRTSASTTRAIVEVIQTLVRTGDGDAYCRAAERLRRHPDHRHHQEDLAVRDPRPWRVRLTEALHRAASAIDCYAQATGSPERVS